MKSKLTVQSIEICIHLFNIINFIVLYPIRVVTIRAITDNYCMSSLCYLDCPPKKENQHSIVGGCV